MSAEASGWVFRHSPYSGASFACHVAIADTVNDQHGNRFWMSQGKTATKARISRKSVNEALAQMVADGYLQRIGPGPGDTVAYVFLFPDAPVVYDSRQGVTPGYKEGVTPGYKGCNEGLQGVSPDVTQTQENSIEPNGGARKRAALRGTRIPEMFTVTPEMVEWAKHECPDVDWAHATKMFVAHWKAEGRAIAVKRDWNAAWRKWLLKDQGDRKRGAARTHL